MNIYPIKTEQDYKNTLLEIENLMMSKANTPEGDRLDVLVTLVEDYERKHRVYEILNRKRQLTLPRVTINLIFVSYYLLDRGQKLPHFF